MKQSSQAEVVCFGEVLWDILPSGPLPGGAPMNVTYHLKKLGTAAALISRVGVDDYGKDLIKIFSLQGLSTEYVDVDYEHDTGLVYANPNEHNEVVYDIVFPSAWDFIGWNDEFSGLVENSKFFVYGSLTSRSKTSRNTLERLLEIAKNKVLDINLRPPHFNRRQVAYLLKKSDILKMNIAELELITGWFSKFNSVEDRIKLIQDRFKINTVIVTMGGDGAIVNDNGVLYRHPGFKVIVADTIGSGDSFLAGFLNQLLNGAVVKKALDYASAVGALIATKPGACPEYDSKEVEDLIKNTVINI